MAPFARIALGVVLSAVIQVGVLFLEGGHLSSILDLTSTICVLGGSLGFMLMAYPWKAHRVAWRAAVGRGGDAPEMTLARRYFGALGAAFLNFGLLGMVFGMIHVMDHLDKPELIGPGIALSFLCIFYGFGMKVFVADACRASAEGRSAAGVDAPHPASTVPTAQGAARDPRDHEIAALKQKVGDLIMRLDRPTGRDAA